MDHLYPTLDDPSFNVKIAKRKEFFDTASPSRGTIDDLEAIASSECNKPFEVSPHQAFVRNYTSPQTPYTGLLLYHGLGTGKTCTAIGVAEENRNRNGARTIVVASPAVQASFRNQLVDESKLRIVDGYWRLDGCMGNHFLKEVNPANISEIPREEIIRRLKKSITNNYRFFGYLEFANYIDKKGNVKSSLSPDKQTQLSELRLRQAFANRMIIIDEVHNIRSSSDNASKAAASQLMRLVKAVPTLKLLLLSATPMYNSPSEIIWILNLLRANDRREPIAPSTIFDSGGRLIEGTGIAELRRKSRGYVSFVEGGDRFTFPFRVWPSQFDTRVPFPDAEISLLGTPILPTLKFLDTYKVAIKPPQSTVYEDIVSKIPVDSGLGYTTLQKPLEALSIVFPLGDGRFALGKEGLRRVVSFKNQQWPPLRNQFRYRPDHKERMFDLDRIGMYSAKIESIMRSILKSEGVVLVYAQFIDGGVIPLALALESLGFKNALGSSLFATPQSPPLDVETMKNTSKTKSQAAYVMITGDKSISEDNAKAVALASTPSNVQGAQVKVIIISQAGSEGLDFKFVRQVHVMDPWYNLNRIEQIIGRAIRRCSHKALPLAKRNAEIYLYAAAPGANGVQRADEYVYRLAENKAITMGEVTRELKSNAVDCLLNNYRDPILPPSIPIVTATRADLDFNIEKKAFTAQCDYMASCEYKCEPDIQIDKDQVTLDSYSEAFLFLNTQRIITVIKDIYREEYVLSRQQLISRINVVREYPQLEIDAALDRLLTSQSELLTDKYDRLGRLTVVGNNFMFVPIELVGGVVSAFHARTPLSFKRRHLVVSAPKKKTVKKEKASDVIIDDKWVERARTVGKAVTDDAELLETAIVDHLLDQLGPESLIEKLNSGDGAIQNYVSRHTVSMKGTTAIQVASPPNTVLVITSGTPRLASALEQNEFAPEIIKSMKALRRSSEKVLGFLELFKKTTWVFKTYTKSSSRNKGARCDQSSKKAIDEIRDTLQLPIEIKAMTRPDQCIAIEIALRIEGIRGRTAFLTPAQALLYFVKK